MASLKHETFAQRFAYQSNQKDNWPTIMSHRDSCSPISEYFACITLGLASTFQRARQFPFPFLDPEQFQPQLQFQALLLALPGVMQKGIPRTRSQFGERDAIIPLACNVFFPLHQARYWHTFMPSWTMTPLQGTTHCWLKNFKYS